MAEKLEDQTQHLHAAKSQSQAVRAEVVEVQSEQKKVKSELTEVKTELREVYSEMHSVKSEFAKQMTESVKKAKKIESMETLLRILEEKIDALVTTSSIAAEATVGTTSSLAAEATASTANAASQSLLNKFAVPAAKPSSPSSSPSAPVTAVSSQANNKEEKKVPHSLHIGLVSDSPNVTGQNSGAPTANFFRASRPPPSQPPGHLHRSHQPPFQRPPQPSPWQTQQERSRVSHPGQLPDPPPYHPPSSRQPQSKQLPSPSRQTQQETVRVIHYQVFIINKTLYTREYYD